MSNLNAKAIGGLAGLGIVMAAALFLSAGTLAYWQAWVFLVVFLGSSLAVTLYLMKQDPELLARRVYAGPGAEKAKSQQIIQWFVTAGFLGMLIVPALDYRFHWSNVPLFAVLLGDALVALGFLIIFFVYRENSFTSATVEVYSGQEVISTGLYGVVRHPMYLGGLILFPGIVLSLGSLWGLIVLPVIVPVIIWRIFDEEALLSRELPGYDEYKRKVRYRLIPFVW